MKEQMAYMYGEEFCGLLAEKIEEANHKRSTSMRSHLWGHHKRNDVFLRLLALLLLWNKKVNGGY